MPNIENNALQSWLWPDHAIGKRESRRLRDEHNRTVNLCAELVTALQIIADSEPLETGTFVCDFQSLQSVARAAITKATGKA